MHQPPRTHRQAAARRRANNNNNVIIQPPCGGVTANLECWLNLDPLPVSLVAYRTASVPSPRPPVLAGLLLQARRKEGPLAALAARH